VKRISPVVAAFTCVFVVAVFGTASASLFDTGDKDLDENLEQLNVEAKKDLEGFGLDMSVQFGVEKEKIEAAIQVDKMEPAEVYFALKLAIFCGKSFETVMSIHKNNRGKGWGVVAQALGIKPGSDSFKRLKESVGKKPGKTASQNGGDKTQISTQTSGAATGVKHEKKKVKK
jgi:hypothetical protein